MIKKALILAAGKGKRMWPLTENKPKPLLPIVGKSIIEKQIIELKKAGVKEVNVLIGYKMNKISDKLFSSKRSDKSFIKDLSNEILPI